MSTQENIIDLYDDVSNPLDSIEEIMLNNDWTFDRPTEDELSVQVSSKTSTYNMHFVWQENYSAMQFCCEPDITIAPNKMIEAVNVVNKINASLWLGHFDIKTPTKAGDALIPRFRHTSLLRGMNESSGLGHIEDLIDIAVNECERFQMTFSLLSKTNQQNRADVALSMMDIAGRS